MKIFTTIISATYFLLSFIYPLIGQQYKAVYEYGLYNIPEAVNHGEVDLNRIWELQKDLRFVLFFDSEGSSFELKDDLVVDQDKFYYKLATSTTVKPDDLYFRNQTAKIRKTESTGRKLLIEYPLDQYSWKILPDKKEIMGYSCQKAVGSWEEYDHRRKKLLKFEPVVWFTEELPYPFGPKGFDGLPGLVFEASFGGKSFYRITSLEEVTSNRKTIDDVKSAKRVSLEEYQKMIANMITN